MVKNMMELDMRFENLEKNSNNHYEGFDDVKAELFKVQSMCKM